MIKIEDIFESHIENWKVYNKLLEKNFFVPVVGAGLSAGIGIGDWNKLLITLAKKVFMFWDKKTIDEIEEKLGGTEGNLDKRVQEMDVLLQQCGERGRNLVQDSLDGLKEIDKKDRSEDGKKEAYIQERIDLIRKFYQEGKREPDFVKIGYSLFYKLLNRKAYFSTYEAAEVLNVVSTNRQDLRRYLYEVINPNGQKRKLLIGEDKAVYWLADILVILKESKENQNRSNVVDCFTTNYDDIIESTCSMISDTEVKVEHLHGKFDSQENPNLICLCLSDLLEIYSGKFDEVRISRNRGVDLLGKGNSDIPFLFLGTSFSENHIGRLVISGISHRIYGISPFANVGEKMMYLERMEKFGIGKDAAFFYPVENWNHEALVVLLHQLARDLKKKFWNDWTDMDYLPKPIEPVTELVKHMIENAVHWLKNCEENEVLYIEEGNDCEFIPEKKTLIFCGSGIVYNICKKIKEEFMRPRWSSYWETDKFEFERDDIEPLGDTLYIYLKVDESEEDFEKFKRQVESWYLKPQKNSWRYRIVRFKLSTEEKEEINNKRREQNEAIGKETQKSNPIIRPIHYPDKQKQVEKILELIFQAWVSTYNRFREREKLMVTEYGFLMSEQFYDDCKEILSEVGKFDRFMQEISGRVKEPKKDDVSNDYSNNYSFEDSRGEVNEENDLKKIREK